MILRLAVSILVLGTAACGLLAMRQSRFETAHEMARLHGRLVEHEQTLWRLRAAIHDRLGEDGVARLAEEYARENATTLRPFFIGECEFQVVREVQVSMNAGRGRP